MFLFSLALVPAVIILLGIEREEKTTRATLFALSALIPTAAAGALAAAKESGNVNSFLTPFCLVAFVVTLASAKWFHHANPHRWLALHLAMAASLVVDLHSIPRTFRWAREGGVHGDDNYAAIVELARDLPGIVRCPDDPTIPLFAVRDPGRSLHAELDAVAQRILPEDMKYEIARADWIIRVHATWDAHLRRGAQETLLPTLGFECVDRMGVYSVWKRMQMPSHEGRMPNDQRL